MKLCLIRMHIILFIGVLLHRLTRRMKYDEKYDESINLAMKVLWKQKPCYTHPYIMKFKENSSDTSHHLVYKVSTITIYGIQSVKTCSNLKEEI